MHACMLWLAMQDRCLYCIVEHLNPVLFIQNTIADAWVVKNLHGTTVVLCGQTAFFFIFGLSEYNGKKRSGHVRLALQIAS